MAVLAFYCIGHHELSTMSFRFYFESQVIIPSGHFYFPFQRNRPWVTMFSFHPLWGAAWRMSDFQSGEYCRRPLWRRKSGPRQRAASALSLGPAKVKFGDLRGRQVVKHSRETENGNKIKGSPLTWANGQADTLLYRPWRIRSPAPFVPYVKPATSRDWGPVSVIQRKCSFQKFLL